MDRNYPIMQSALTSWNGFYSERTIEGLQTIELNYLSMEVKYERWQKTVLPVRELPSSTGLSEVTRRSRKVVARFLNNLLYLPLSLQFDLMEKLQEEMFLSSPAANDIRGSFRGTIK